MRCFGPLPEAMSCNTSKDDETAMPPPVFILSEIWYSSECKIKPLVLSRGPPWYRLMGRLLSLIGKGSSIARSENENSF